MSSWTDGYVVETSYTYGYYTELNPLRAQFLLSAKGIKAPDKIDYACELGFGQGISVNIHAAAGSALWYGTDFNPSQTSFAKELGAKAETAINLYDDSFAEFVKREDLPQFDFIGIHGIWSWISPANCQALADFIKKHLNVGGILYISYNTLPGFASFEPVRHLFVEYTKRMSAQGHNILGRIDDALSFTDKAFACNPDFLKANPSLKKRLGLLKNYDKRYLAHEYFNKDWQPMHFADVAEILDESKVNFAGEADFNSLIDSINLTKDQHELLSKIEDPHFYETIRDFMINRQFRRDLWVKGVRRLTVRERQNKVCCSKFVLLKDPSLIAYKILGHLGEASLKKEIHAPIVDFLSDYKVHSFADIQQISALSRFDFNAVLAGVVALCGIGAIACAQDYSEKQLTACSKINHFFTENSLFDGRFSYLASPVTGGGIAVSRFDQIFIYAVHEKKLTSAVDLADFAFTLLKKQGKSIKRNDNTILNDEEGMKKLSEEAEAFIKYRLSVFKTIFPSVEKLCDKQIGQ